ncbi:TPA: AAA family ATPase [Corynebacterium striatum]|nr:AAA family ATPase [Corynebacterium striatum]
MTPKFWISSVTVAGHPFKPDSSVQFTRGLNVICGPSNSGKSWVLDCIDYAFGKKSSEFALDESNGYTEVRLRLSTSEGNITIKRPIGKGNTNVEVTSTNPSIESGTYKSRQTKKHRSVDSIPLQLIGYEDPEKLMVITNQDFKTQAFTWRTFWPACYADEDRIASKPSVLLPTQNTAATAAKCALASLITGRDYAAWARDESTDAKKLKNNAVIEYLEQQPEKIAARIEQIEKILGTSDEDEIKHRISEISHSMEQVQQRIALAMAEGRRIVGQLQQVRESLAESSALGARYEELAASYRARIDRLDFVQQGMHLLSEHPPAHSCPVCDRELDPAMPNDVPDPNPTERDELSQRLADLNQTLRQMGGDQGELRLEQKALQEQADQINQLIRGELQPELDSLRTALDNHTALVAMRAERDELMSQQGRIAEEIKERRGKQFTKGTFNPLGEFPEGFWTAMGTNLLDTLGACAFPALKKATFSRQLFDATINGKSKAKQGKGYRSFVNTAVMLSLRDYLASDEASHNPGLLIIDTPLLGLDDQQLDQELMDVREKIPQALYEHFINVQDKGQIIIADNTKFMPDLDSIDNACNVIRFTRRTDQGRFGFLIDMTDEDLKDQEETDGN